MIGGLCWRGDLVALKRRGWFLASSVISLCALGLLAAALATGSWVRSDLQRSININNRNSSYKIAIYGGYKNFGLFRGCEEKHYGTFTGPRRRCFDALLEVEAISDVHMVYGTLVGLVSACFFLLVAIHICVYIECAADVKEILETTTLYFMHTCSVVTTVVGCGMYGFMFHQDFKRTILTPLDINEGFTSSEAIVLGYSYWLTLVAVLFTIVNIIGICIVNIKNGKNSCFNPDFSRRTQADNFPVGRKIQGGGRADMMMY